MIRINLLPFRAERKKENIRRQVSVYFLSILFLVAVAGYLFLNLTMTLGDLTQEAARKRQELNTYAAVTREIKAIEDKIQELESKLKVIRTLEAAKTGPVHLLDEIAMAVPEEVVDRFGDDLIVIHKEGWWGTHLSIGGLAVLPGCSGGSDRRFAFAVFVDGADRVEAGFGVADVLTLLLGTEVADALAGYADPSRCGR